MRPLPLALLLAACAAPAEPVVVRVAGPPPACPAAPPSGPAAPKPDACVEDWFARSATPACVTDWVFRLGSHKAKGK